MASCSWVRSRAAARAPRIVAIATALLTLVATLAVGADAAAAASATTPSVRLLHVTPVVRRAGQPVVVTLTRTGPATASGATVQLTLYSRLTTRSALLAAISAPGPSGPVSTTGPLEAGCLARGAALSVGIPVAPDGVAVAPHELCGRAGPVLRLGPSAGAGVYPLRVTVRGGGATATIDTLVTYATTASPSPLLVAWIVRVAGGSGQLAGSVPALAGVAAHPTVPLTVDVQGSTLAAAPSSSGGASALKTVVARPTVELVNEAYVPAELGTLRASQLPDEVIRQFELNVVALKADGITTLPSTTVTYGTGPQTPTSADALAKLGIRHVVVPSTALVVDPATTLSWGSAFRVGGAPSGPTALASDAELSSLSDDAASDPGLTGANLLGELAFLHFEQPDLSAPRVAVVVTDATPSVTSSFVGTVLSGLHDNPVVTPVTISGAFQRVGLGANGFPAVRDLVDPPSTPYPTPTITFLRHLRITTDALSSAVRGPATPIPSIEGELLSAEQVLSPSERLAVMNEVQHDLEEQLGYFKIYDGPITLTQSGAQLPFTIYSTAPYGIAGFLQLSSPKLTFPQGSKWKLPGPVGAYATLRVPATAEVTGDIALTAILYSPLGHLKMATAVITVRATHTSIVGIALTVLAVLVLALWWIRTSRKRRAARH
jgi:hypothetical protein